MPVTKEVQIRSAFTVKETASAHSSFAGGGGAGSVVKLQIGQPVAGVLLLSGTICQ